MKENTTIFDHIGNILNTFGVSVLVLLFVCGVFGDDAREMSSMFQLGSKGLALETMLQYLAVAVVIEIIRSFFFSDRFIKNASNTLRSGGMVFTIIMVVVLFIIAFDWFPVNKALPWIMFLVSFGICFSIVKTCSRTYLARSSNSFVVAKCNVNDILFPHCTQC